MITGMTQKQLNARILPVILALLCACAAPVPRAGEEPPLPIPPVRFAVISDIHIHAARLGASGRAFVSETSSDRKLLGMSEEILDAALAMIGKERPDFVIVCGDLTKDGERINHEVVAGRLGSLTAGGTRIFVVPGNHDVANGFARSYAGDRAVPVESVGPGEFREIYRNVGYGEAIDADPDSLSYVTEPVPGLWLLALDSCLWREQKPGRHSITEGAFSRRTVEWIGRTLEAARAQQKGVIAFMHHGIAEHYPGNKKYFGMYLVRDFDRIGRMLADHGVRAVFTGHFHAQDVTIRRYDDTRFIADVETGSLVTYPCPYRIVSVDARQVMSIESRYVAETASMPRGFTDYARDYTLASTARFARRMLGRYGVNGKDRELLGDQLGRAYLAHIRGDEVMPTPAVDETGISPGGKIALLVARSIIEGWYTDLPPADNIVRFDLKTGR